MQEHKKQPSPDLPSAFGYFICGSPRSGSTMLCDLLEQTAVAGVPESYFRTQSIAGYMRKWNVSSNPYRPWGQSYIDAVCRHARTDNGCLGVRIMWSNMPQLLESLASIFPSERTDKDRIRLAFGVTQYVHLYREDKVAQAVSLVLAKQTGLWHLNEDKTIREGADVRGKPHYNEAHIEQELEMLEDEALGWSTWFEEQSITPIRLSYEVLAANPQTSLKGILEQILNQPFTAPMPNIGTSPTNTTVNAQWVKRFRSGRRPLN